MKILKDEYALFMIKPDGVKKNVLLEFTTLCNECSIEVNQIKKRIICEEDVVHLFNTGNNETEYKKYLSSSEVIVGICRGKHVYEKIKNIKYKIRNKYNVNNCMQNLLHTSEPGHEYSRQMDYFFNEVPIAKYTLGSDLCIILDDNNIVNESMYIENNTNLSFIGILLNDKILSNEFHFKYTKVVYCIKKNCIINNIVVPILIYSYDKYYLKHIYSNNISKQELLYQNNKNIIISVDYINYSLYKKESIKQMINNVYEEGIDTILVFEPRIEFQYLNIVEFWSVTKKDMNYVGGSNGVKGIGLFSIDINDKLFNFG
jgi:Nucleoside diphosphate kinase.